MSDDITQKLRVTMPDFKGIEISCPCRIRSSLMKEAADVIERQARHIEELREKIDAEGSCACSFDGPGDICAAHSPALMQALAEIERLRAEKEDLYASIAGIERAAAGAIYSQESIHAMALYALKPLMERGIEALEAKP